MGYLGVLDSRLGWFDRLTRLRTPALMQASEHEPFEAPLRGWEFLTGPAMRLYGGWTLRSAGRRFPAGTRQDFRGQENYGDPGLVRRYNSFEVGGLARSSTEWLVGYRSILDWVVDPCIGLPIRSKRVLDFGCGPGTITRLFAEHGAREVVGVDISKPMVEHAIKHNPRELWNGRLSFKEIKAGARLPFDDGCFDLINSSFVLCTFPRKDAIERAVAEFYRVLKDDGLCLVLHSNWDVSHGTDFLSFRLPHAPHLRDGDEIRPILKGEREFEVKDFFWSKRTLAGAFEAAGFKDVMVTDLYPVDLTEADLSDSRLKAEREKPPFYLIAAHKGGVFPPENN